MFKLRVNASMIDNKPIFMNRVHKQPVSIREAREAYDISAFITDPAQKEAIYLMYGVDGEATEKYLIQVEKFENAYNKTHTSHWELFLRIFKDFIDKIPGHKN